MGTRGKGGRGVGVGVEKGSEDNRCASRMKGMLAKTATKTGDWGSNGLSESRWLDAKWNQSQCEGAPQWGKTS